MWSFQEDGILPRTKSSEDSIEAIVMFNDEIYDYEDEDADQVYGTLNRNSRRRLKKALNEMKISEVYSEPRIAKAGKAMGLQQGTSFDIKTGYDFTRLEDRARAWRKLQQEKPDLLVLCPPCGPFSMLQEWNYPRMGIEKAMYMLGEGVEHLTFAMEMFQWQVMEGRWALFEHPSTSRAWQEECVQEVLRLPEVQRVIGDQCQFQLQVHPEEALNKKATGFMTNSACIARRLGVRCQGGHEHQPLVSGRAKKAEVYPDALCKAVVRGLKEENSQCCVLAEFDIEEGVEEANPEGDIEEALDEEVERQGQPLPGRMIPAPERADEEEEREGAIEDPEGGPLRRGVSEADKRKIHKLHVNLGHPSKEDFVRALRMAKAREEVWRYVKYEYQCDLCRAHQKPTLNRPAALPRLYEPGRTVGVDVVYFPGVEPNETIPVLNVTDWGSCYQALEPLDNVSAEEVWWKFMRCWGRVFGIPELVIVDQGREFLGAFAQRINEAGAVVKTIGARAPHQQGRTERHGGLAKQMYLRMRDQVRPDNRREWETMIYAVEQAKNRLYNRSGFSPAQRQIGQNIRIPGSLASDDPFEPSLVRHGATGEVQKLMAIRELAMEAFVKQTTVDASKRAQRAKGRSNKEFHTGEIVYVYRGPLARRSVRGEDDTKRAQWVGPGTVVLVEGPNVWVSMRGEVWKCAKEQVRQATMEEEEAFGLLKEELQELKEEINRRSSKRGFKDITMFGYPPEEAEAEEEDDVVQEPPHQRRRVSEEAGGEAPEPEQDPAAGGSQQGTGQEESSSSSSSSSETGDSRSREEPEGERIEDDQMDAAVRSSVASEILDGTLMRSQLAEDYAPRRARLEKMRFKPYHSFLRIEGEEEPEEEMMQEGWYYEEKNRCLIRRHVIPRKGAFVPHHKRGCPIEVHKLKSRSWATRSYDHGGEEEKEENWRSEEKKENGPLSFWTGYTTFQLKPGVKEDEIKWHLVAGKGSDEVKEEDITPEEWPQWRVADGEEWAKVSSTDAVKTLDIEESQEVRRQLSESGKLSRILPSRIVRRWKPAELPGEAPSRKSRWCVRGDKDPDLLQLDRYAPTVTTAVISIALQVAATRGFRCALGDLKNAFMQSDPLRRQEGRLFCKQPCGGLPGLHPEQLIEILAGAYGLEDAPAHWRKSLKKVLVELGYVQSSMDPCLFKLVREEKLEGLVVVEVDDILSLGSAAHYEQMNKLQQRFKFGKFKFLDEQPDGAAFNGRRMRATAEGGFLLDMEKFISERLKEVPLDKERMKMKGEDATPQERADTRATIGALTWAAKEGRPDCAACASLIAGCLNKLKVQDIIDLNRTVKEVKASCELGVPIQPIPEDEMCWGVITDASYANAETGSSQGAFGVVCYEKKLLTEGKSRGNLIHWKSSKIHRVVNSTLAAEAQSLSKGLSELAWSITVFNEMIDPKFDLKKWEEGAKHRRLQALAKQESDEKLRSCLGVVDAKSLFDHLVKETIGSTEDKRTAIEMQVIRQSLSEIGAQVKWVPHVKMTIDCLTKRNGNRGPLIQLLTTGVLDFQQSGQQELVGV